MIHALATIPVREMNRTEEKYDKYLALRMAAKEIQWKGFECIKLRLADKTHYTPDFMVVTNTFVLEMHEVKAYWRGAQQAGWQEDSRVKIKACAEFFPFKFIAAVLMPDGSWEFEEF